MNPIDQLDKLEKIDASKATETINKTIKSYDFLWEANNLIFISVIAGLFLISYFISTRFPDSLLKEQKNSSPFLRNITSRKMLTAILFSAFVWIGYVLSDHVKLDQESLRIAGILSSSWVIIYSLTKTKERNIFALSFAFFIWAIIALYTLSFLDDFLKLSKEISVEAGAIQISLYSVISAFAIFGILFWLSSKIEFYYNRAVDKSRGLTRAQKVLYKKIAKFILVALIFMIGFRMLNIDITSIAVVTGAVAFGIGFGLQKIFANLISGIILLVDKSIKPGDVIAVGDAYGIVTNLEGRYASVITRDGKKHLIPNEILVTQPVENWSYRDDKVRLSVTVGVSYESDPKEVQKIILSCADNHPRVLKDPPPVCLFANFGESSIDFELRFWITDPVNGIGFPQSEIRFAIWEALKKQKISIPYPHRTVVIQKGVEL